MKRALLITLILGLAACGSDSTENCELGSVTLNVSGHTQPLYVTLKVDEEITETKIVDIETSTPTVFTDQVGMCESIDVVLANASEHQSCEVQMSADSLGKTIDVQCVDVCNGNTDCLTWRNGHNEYRRLMNEDTIPGATQNYPVPSPALNDLVWNTKLAQVAQAHADACVYEHNGERLADFIALGGENVYLGENIAFNAFSEPLQPRTEYQLDQLEAWWNEYNLWDYQAYNSGTINGASHFTQIIWANTAEVGCGTAFCPAMYNGLDAYFSVCNYKTGGNYQGQYPYSTN